MLRRHSAGCAALFTLSAIAAAFAAAPVAAQEPPPPPPGFQRCGDPSLVLVFLNPDLVPNDAGLIPASGTFFIQFQARGERALDIETFTYSVGKALPGAPINCDTPLWLTGGVFIQDYRCDPHPEDGFFIPIDTTNVPDGEYISSVSAWDAAGNELVRYWATAIVENGKTLPMDEPGPDKVMPWPMILPGDGERLDGGPGLYIEVAEPVASIEAFLNGAKLQLEETPAPPRDDDVAPCTRQLGESSVESRAYGQAWLWDGALGAEDVVKVRLTDLYGNMAEKVVHIGDPTIGGRVVGTAPEIEVEVDSVEQESDANGTAAWSVTYRTLTDAGLHGDLYLRGRDGAPLPQGLEPRMRPNHVMLGGREELRGTVFVTGTNASLGKHNLALVIDYLYGAQRLQHSTPLVFSLTTTGQVEDPTASKAGVEPERLRGEDINATAQPEPEAPAEPPRRSPGPAEALAIAGVAAVALAARRRR